MQTHAKTIPGYTYGSAAVATSPVSLAELTQLKISVGMTADVETALKLAGETLTVHVKEIVDRWRAGIIASIPHLARHSRTPTGEAIPDYLAASNLRFRQWILDSCLRVYDQDWLNYQHEIALRHTSLKKNVTDGVTSTPFVPLRDVIAFTAVMNETIKPYLATRGHASEQVEAMHRAWCKSIQLQLALWAKTFADPALAGREI